MKAITIKIEDDMYAEFEQLRTSQFYSKTEYLRDALRQKIIKDKIRLLQGSQKGNPVLSKKQKQQVFKEFLKSEGLDNE